MTCGNLMTRNPSCCLPGDSVSTAARIMKQQDVGPVLVVNDQSEMKLLGIVTDRDIAINVVAEGRDPYSTRVDSVMTGAPVSCGEDEDVADAMKRMAEYQVRRIPVVDENGSVVGIISQADIARGGQDEEVGELVEEISQPWGSGEAEARQFSGDVDVRSPGMDTVSALAIGALCVGFGAGLMFLFDPSKGRRRRAQFAERGTELWTNRDQMIQRTRGAITESAQNLAAAARSRLGSKPEDVPDQKQFTPAPATGNLTT